MRTLAPFAASIAASAFALSAAAAELQLSPATQQALDHVDAGRGAQAIAMAEPAAAKGDASAAILLGELYLLGSAGVTIDQKRGCDYVEPWKERYGHAADLYARCLAEGEGRPKDEAQARVWYERAIDMGYRYSLCSLGTLYQEGRGGPADPKLGFTFCLLAAEEGDAAAQTEVANRYLTGTGTKQDDGLARHWYRKAADRGEAVAAYNLGLMLANGRGGPEDLPQAAGLFELAYEKGETQAALQRGLLESRQLTGKDVPTDIAGLDRAIIWRSSDPDIRARAIEQLALARKVREAMSRFLK